MCLFKNLINDFRFHRRSCDVFDSLVFRSALVFDNVDGYDPAVIDEVAQRRKVQGRPADPGTRFDDEVWAKFMNNFLVDPQIERVLDNADSEPSCVTQGLPEIPVVEQ